MVFVDPDASPDHARVAYPDREAGRLVVGLALGEEPDVVRHEYTHYVLEGTASTGREAWPAAVDALEAGLAYYLPCSFRDDPIHGGLYDLRAAPHPAPGWLDPAHREGLAWAAVMWQLRTAVGAQSFDGLLLDAWRATATLPNGPNDGAFVEHIDCALADQHVSSLQGLLTARGIPPRGTEQEQA